MKPPPEWWSSYFDAMYLREHEPLFSPERDRSETARLIDVLGLPAGARVLDVPCGQGRHARLLAEAGFRVDALDYSAHLLQAARRLGTAPGLRYTRGDMRSFSARWTGRFDGVVNLFTSFGFFLQPADDQRVIAGFARVLKPGGVLIWHGASRDGVMARFLMRDWWRTSDATLFAQERAFDVLSGVLTVRTEWSGPDGAGERSHRIRLYSATHLAELLARHGLVVEESFDGWSERALHRGASEMLLVARKE